MYRRAVTTFLRHNSAYSVIGCTSATAGVLGVSYKRAFSTVVAEKAREALRLCDTWGRKEGFRFRSNFGDV
eukprot:1354981-Amorphochlora_amoeboformis.AAC.1